MGQSVSSIFQQSAHTPQLSAGCKLGCMPSGTAASHFPFKWVVNPPAATTPDVALLSWRVSTTSKLQDCPTPFIRAALRQPFGPLLKHSNMPPAKPDDGFVKALEGKGNWVPALAEFVTTCKGLAPVRCTVKSFTKVAKMFKEFNRPGADSADGQPCEVGLVGVLRCEGIVSHQQLWRRKSCPFRWQRSMASSRNRVPAMECATAARHVGPIHPTPLMHMRVHHSLAATRPRAYHGSGNAAASNPSRRAIAASTQAGFCRLYQQGHSIGGGGPPPKQPRQPRDCGTLYQDTEGM